MTVDALRADHCSSYGYRRQTTPRIDRLAREGARIELAYAPIATSGPSHATMFTGLYPLSHGVLKNGWTLGPEPATLAETLAARGYETAAVVSSFALARKFGLSRGFGEYDDDFGIGAGSPQVWEGQSVPGRFDRPADQTRARAVAWLQRRLPARPFFLWVHLFDPHAPYEPPAELRDAFPGEPGPKGDTARTIALYDAEVLFADRELGMIVDALDRLGLRESTIVAVTADHGEGLGEHGHWQHGLMIYEEAVRVPLVFRWPGHIPGGRALRGPVEHVDLFPTLVELAFGAPTPVGQGHSLAPALLARAELDPRRRVFLQRRLYDEGSERALHVKGEKFGVREGDWKYLAAADESREELFDLAADPGELNNALARHPDEARRLRAALEAWRQATPRPRVLPQGVSPQDAEKLRALGYVQ